MKLVENLLRVARAIMIKRLLAFFAISGLHLNKQIVVLNLRLGHRLLRRLRLLHERHVGLEVALLLDIFLLCHSLVGLSLHVGLFVLLPVADLIREFLVCGIHIMQIFFYLTYQRCCILRLLLATCCVPELAKETQATLQRLIVCVCQVVHLSFELSEILVVSLRLVVVFVDADDVILLAQLHVEFDFSHFLLVRV